MTTAALTVVETGSMPEPRAETRAQKIGRLQLEARTLAKGHVADFVADLLASAEAAEEIAKGGEAFPVGVRELASRLANELKSQGLAMESLYKRIET